MKFFKSIITTAILAVTLANGASAAPPNANHHAILGRGERTFRLFEGINSASRASGCPSDYPLDCSNGTCCAAGSTYYCAQMEPTPCINPDELTDEGLRIMRDKCSPLLTCKE